MEGSIGGTYSDVIWSPDNTRLLYTSGNHELRIITIDGRKSESVLRDTSYNIYPLDWSRDGNILACEFESTKKDSSYITAISATSRQVRFLSSVASNGIITGPRISPDGKYFACGLFRHNNWDIYVWSVDGSREIRVTDHPALDENPQWSADGNYLVFMSDRAKTFDLWAVKMNDGAPSGPFQLISRNLGRRTRLSNLSTSGKLLLVMYQPGEPANLLLLPVDEAQGVARGSLAQISMYPTDHYSPRFSPDGKKVAYGSYKGQLGWPRIYILDESGTETEIRLRAHYVNTLAWHPDGIHLLFAGFDSASIAGISQISTDTQEIRTLYMGEHFDHGTFAGFLLGLNYAAVTSKLIFVKQLTERRMEIYSAGLSGKDVQLISPPLGMSRPVRSSPDGKFLCYTIADTLFLFSVDRQTPHSLGISSPGRPVDFGCWSPSGQQMVWTDGRKLILLSLETNLSRTLYEVSTDKLPGNSTWSPNGSFIVFVVKDSSAIPLNRPELHIVSPQGGSVRRLAEAPKGYDILEDLQWSPDGGKIMATGRSAASLKAPFVEYWVMENFLPKDNNSNK